VHFVDFAVRRGYNGSLAKMTEDGTRCSGLEQPLMSTAVANNTEAEEGSSSQIEIPRSSLKNHDHKTTTALPLSKLCLKCRNIFDRWDQIPFTELRQVEDFPNGAFSDSSSPQIKGATFSHHNSLLELESSAKEGCTLCGQFVKDERILEACRERIQELLWRFPNVKFVGQVEVGLVPDKSLLDNYWGLVWNIVPGRVDPYITSQIYSSYNSRYLTSAKYLEVCILPIPEPGRFG
jgi:hypothetical protein